MNILQVRCTPQRTRLPRTRGWTLRRGRTLQWQHAWRGSAIKLHRYDITVVNVLRYPAGNPFISINYLFFSKCATMVALKLAPEGGLNHMDLVIILPSLLSWSPADGVILFRFRWFGNAAMLISTHFIFLNNMLNCTNSTSSSLMAAES